MGAILSALGVGRTASWSEAYALLARAAALGDASARAQLELVGRASDVAVWVDAPAPREHFAAPRVLSFEQFIPPAWCAWIMQRAHPSLAAARVKNPAQGGANVDAIRTNAGMGFSVLDTDLVIQVVHARIAATLALPVMHQEPTNVLHYQPGQEYKPHFDFLDPGEVHFAVELQRVGQRVATFLIYLNDDYEGGETAFPRLDWRFKGKAGDALAFWNVTEGRPDPRTLHAGLAPTRGDKWLLSKWVRDRPLPLV